MNRPWFPPSIEVTWAHFDVGTVGFPHIPIHPQGLVHKWV